jgi:hypothetical protein
VHETDRFNRQPELLAAEMKGTAGAGQQSAHNPQSNQLTMQQEDLELTAAPPAGCVNVDD